MKKLFIVLAVASLGFVACNNESKTEEVKDNIDSTASAQKDSVETTSDSVKSTIDSTAAAAKDSLSK